MVVKARKYCQSPSSKQANSVAISGAGILSLPSFSMAPPRSTFLNGGKVAYQERKILAS